MTDDAIYMHDEVGNVVLYNKVAVDFDVVLHNFEKAFHKTISVPTMSPKRVYIQCSKEYINEPNKTWWMVLLVDALLTAFHNNIPKRPNGYFDAHATLRNSLLASMASALPPPHSKYQLQVMNVPAQWNTLDSIHQHWVSLTTIKNSKHTEKRAKLLNTLRASCFDLDASFPSIIEEGLSVVLERMWLANIHHTSTQKNTSHSLTQTAGKKRKTAAASKYRPAAWQAASTSRPAAGSSSSSSSSSSSAVFMSGMVKTESAPVAEEPESTLNAFQWPNVEDKLLGLSQIAFDVEEVVTSMASKAEQRPGEAGFIQYAPDGSLKYYNLESEDNSEKKTAYLSDFTFS